MTYSDEYFTIRETWRDWRIEAGQLVQLARVSNGTRVLEVGCGGGGLLRLFRDKGARVSGIDTLAPALELTARRQSGAGAFQLIQTGEQATLPFRSDSFEAIAGQHVLEHLADVPAALDEFKRVLKPGGRLVLATPNARYPDPAHFADLDHNHIYTPPELTEQVTRAGFLVQSCFTILPYLSHWRALRAVGIAAYRLFQHAPYFTSRGRTIILGATRPEMRSNHAG